MTVYLTYQQLMSAVSVGTSAPSGSVYPNDYKYIAIPMSAVNSVLSSFSAGSWVSESDDCDDKARRLWYKFKEANTLYACGIVRLSHPVPHDVVGVVLEEDMVSTSYAPLADDTPDLLGDNLLGDELAEYMDERISGYSSYSDSIPERERRERTRRTRERRERTRRDRGDGGGSDGGEGGGGGSGRLEITLIDPQTEKVFKRSHGGYFGSGWSVSQVRAFAVWF
jgi:hypothetical protein